MLKSIFIVFYMKGFSKWCIIFIKIIFLGISLPIGRWAICAGKQKNSLMYMYLSRLLWISSKIRTLAIAPCSYPLLQSSARNTFFWFAFTNFEWNIYLTSIVEDRRAQRRLSFRYNKNFLTKVISFHTINGRNQYHIRQ